MAGLPQQGIKPLISARRWKGGAIQGELCNWTLWKRCGESREQESGIFSDSVNTQQVRGILEKKHSKQALSQIVI